MTHFSASFPVLLGSLPKLVRVELLRILGDEPSVQVLPLQPRVGELANAVRRHQPRLVIVEERGTLEELEALGNQCPVLLYQATSELLVKHRLPAPECVYGCIAPLMPSSYAAFSGWRMEILRKVQAIAALTADKAVARPSNKPRGLTLPSGVVVLGGSTGGSAAAEEVLRGILPASTCAILVAIHLPSHFTQVLVERLQRASALPVVAGQAGMPLEPGKVVVAPGGRNMVIKAAPAVPWVRWQTELHPEDSPRASVDSPSIDLLMQSVAGATNCPKLGIILSGLGHDGTQGARAIRQHGGQVIVQDNGSAAVCSMPQAVWQAGLATRALPPSEIADYINRFAAQNRSAQTTRRPTSSHAA